MPTINDQAQISMSAQHLRTMLAAGQTINMPGIYDGLSARLAEQAGFSVGFVSGFAVSAARRAEPDMGYLTPTDIAATTRDACRASKMIIIADADTGYGNARSAQHTARELFAAGAHGVFLEDQQWPKSCGHFDGKTVIETHEWLAKLRAIRDLREEGIDLFLVARTDARAARSLTEAIERAQAAHALGVDAIFVEAPASIDELTRIADATPGAIRVANMVEGGKTPLLTTGELHELGYDLIVTPVAGLFAATRALQDAFSELATQGTMRANPHPTIGFNDFGAVTRRDDHLALDARYGADLIPSTDSSFSDENELSS